jgi:hypothetical protein
MNMQTIEIKKGVEIGFDDLVFGLSRLDLEALTQLFEQLKGSILEPNPLQKYQEEIVLLKKIKAMIPRATVLRLKALQKKRQAQVITPKELSEIIILSDFLEMKSAERIYLVGALAKLRQTSITEVAKQLNLKKFYG